MWLDHLRQIQERHEEFEREQFWICLCIAMSGAGMIILALELL